MAEVSAEESTLAAGSWLPPPSACQLCWPGWVMKDVLGSGCAHIPALNCQFPLLGMAGWAFQLGERSKFQLQGKLPKTEKTVLKKNMNISTTSFTGRATVGPGRVEIEPPVRQHLPSVGAKGEKQTINFLASS